MRNLRDGHVLGDDFEDGLPTALVGGVARSEEAFLGALTEAIKEAARSGQALFVFRFHSRLLGLQQWSDFMPVADGSMERAIDNLVLSLDPDLVILRTARREILGFNGRPLAIGAAERLGGRLVAGLTTSLGDPGQEFVVSPRLGVAVIHGEQSAEQAVEAATRTLRQTNFDMPFLVHNDFVRDRSLRQEQAKNELPGALAKRQISLEFQPRVGVDGMEPVGLEVFPRWHHPERGMVPTLDFLQVAERSGLLVELGRTVRETAAEIASSWAERDILDGRRIWLNISPVELCDRSFLSSVNELSRNHPDVSFGFEVSDSRLLEDPVFFRIFDKLQEIGASLALDNVRSSSLSIGRLRRLPLAMLNLDGELIRGLPTRSSERNLVRLLCSHAAGQRMQVTACEVETAEQLEVATSLGVDAAQGKFVSPPMASERMGAYLRTGTQPPRAI
jgi:EAL domain-containing protein (putative c-di-GMP-specific phosphodiesterase class I)